MTCHLENSEAFLVRDALTTDIIALRELQLAGELSAGSAQLSQMVVVDGKERPSLLDLAIRFGYIDLSAELARIGAHVVYPAREISSRVNAGSSKNSQVRDAVGSRQDRASLRAAIAAATASHSVACSLQHIAVHEPPDYFNLSILDMAVILGDVHSATRLVHHGLEISQQLSLYSIVDLASSCGPYGKIPGRSQRQNYYDNSVGSFYWSQARDARVYSGVLDALASMAHASDETAEQLKAWHFKEWFSLDYSSTETKQFSLLDIAIIWGTPKVAQELARKKIRCLHSPHFLDVLLDPDDWGNLATISWHCVTRRPILRQGYLQTLLEVAEMEDEIVLHALREAKVEGVMHGAALVPFSTPTAAWSILDLAVIEGESILAVRLAALGVPSRFRFRVGHFCDSIDWDDIDSLNMCIRSQKSAKALTLSGIHPQDVQDGSLRAYSGYNMFFSLLDLAIANGLPELALLLKENGACSSLGVHLGSLMMETSQKSGDEEDENAPVHIIFRVCWSAVHAATQAGIDIALLQVDCALALSSQNFFYPTVPPQALAFPFGPEPLLAMAIICGQADLCIHLCSLGGHHRELTSADLVMSWPQCRLLDDDAPCSVNVGIQGMSAALGVVSWGMCYYKVALLQMSKWWARDARGILSIGNTNLLDSIAVFVLPVPFLPELRCQSRSFARATTPREAGTQQPFDNHGYQVPNTGGGNDLHEDAEVYPNNMDKDIEAANEQLMRALQESKADVPALNSDGVVLLRLTRNARSPEVDSLLLNAAGPLAECHSRVISAGCQVSPHWSCGAKLFVPCTQHLFRELEASFEIHEYHIVALAADRFQIQRALQTLPRRQRPRLALELQSRMQNGNEEDLDIRFEDNETDAMVVLEQTSSTNSSIGFPTSAW